MIAKRFRVSAKRLCAHEHWLRDHERRVLVSVEGFQVNAERRLVHEQGASRDRERLPRDREETSGPHGRASRPRGKASRERLEAISERWDRAKSAGPKARIHTGLGQRPGARQEMTVG